MHKHVLILTTKSNLNNIDILCFARLINFCKELNDKIFGFLNNY